jgi:hypothetical protein
LQAAQSCFTLPCGQGLQSAHLRFNLPCGQGLHVTQSFLRVSCQPLSTHAHVVARSPPLAHPTLWSVPAARDEMRRDVRRFVSPSKDVGALASNSGSSRIFRLIFRFDALSANHAWPFRIEAGARSESER